MAEPTILVGKTYDGYEGRIDSDAAQAFALATNDPNPAYMRGGVVPLMYTASLIQSAFGEAEAGSIEPGAIKGDPNAAVHAQHDLYFRAPVTPGQAVRWRITTRSAGQTPPGPLVCQQVVITDLEGSPLVEHLWSTIYVGGTMATDVGPELPDHTFPQEARGHPYASMSFDIDADQTYRYGGVSGDRPPHSLDDEAARREGFPAKILQGMCTFAMCGSAVVKLAAEGDPNRMHRLAGRFAAPVQPRETLLVELYEAGRSDDGRRVFAFEATAGDVTVIKHGRAELNDN